VNPESVTILTHGDLKTETLMKTTDSIDLNLKIRSLRDDIPLKKSCLKKTENFHVKLVVAPLVKRTGTSVDETGKRQML